MLFAFIYIVLARHVPGVNNRVAEVQSCKQMEPFCLVTPEACQHLIQMWSELGQLGKLKCTEL